MSDLSRIDYSYQLTYPQRLGLTFAEFNQYGWKGWFLKWGYFICGAVAGFFGIIVILQIFSERSSHDRGLVLFGALAACVAIFSALSCNAYLHKMIWRSLSRGPRHGSVSTDGVTEEHRGFESRCGWARIIGVERRPKLTLLLLGEGAGYVIPHDSLPDAVTADVLHEHIEQWRKAAE